MELTRALATVATRRDWLRGLAAPLVALGVGAHAAAPIPRRPLWLTLFAGPAGGPVYWLTRGTENVVVDGAATPVRGRINVIAAMVRAHDDGSARASYLLQGCSVTPTGFEFVPKLVHPITGLDLPTAAAPPISLGWNFDPGGAVTEELVAPGGIRAVYRGETWELPGAGDERTATLKLNIRLIYPDGHVETLTELGEMRPRAPFAPEQSGSSPRTTDFIPVDSSTLSLRELVDKTGYKAATVISASLNHGSNFASVADLRRAMRPAEVAALQAFFAQQEEWCRSV